MKLLAAVPLLDVASSARKYHGQCIRVMYTASLAYNLGRDSMCGSDAMCDGDAMCSNADVQILT